MTTNPYENTTSPTSLPSYMPMAPADGEFPSIEQYPETDMPGQAQGRSVVDSEFFRIPEIAPAKIDEIDTTGWSESAKAALAQLDGRGRREQQNDVLMALTARVVSDAFVDHLGQRESRLLAQRWTVDSIAEAEESKNQAAIDAKVAAQRYGRAQQEKQDIDDDMHIDTGEIQQLSVARKSLTAERDELQQQYNALADRAHELAQLKPKEGESILPLFPEERQRYITEAAKFGSLMGIEAGSLEEGSLIERLRAAAVIEKLYLPHYATQLNTVRTQIRELTEQIGLIEERRRQKELSKNRAHENLVRQHLASQRQTTILESKQQDVDEQIAMINLIPDVPEKDFLDQAVSERNARLGRLLKNGLPDLPRPNASGVASGKPAAQLSVGGAVTSRIKVELSYPTPKKEQ
jgi:hypothetical protein